MIEPKNEEIDPSEISLLPVFLTLKEKKLNKNLLEITENELVEIIEKSEIEERYKNFIIANVNDLVELCLNWGILHEIGYRYIINKDNLLLQISLEETD